MVKHFTAKVVRISVFLYSISLPALGFYRSILSTVVIETSNLQRDAYMHEKVISCFSAFNKHNLCCFLCLFIYLFIYLFEEGVVGGMALI